MVADLSITFLGTGTSQGVPMVGCNCTVCHSSDPRDWRTRSSIYVQTPETAWVVDTGPDFRLQCLKQKVTRVDAVLYTHSHTDHVTGFDDLRPFCHNGPLPIYASPSVMADLQRMFTFAFTQENWYPGYVLPEPRLIEGPFMLGNTRITPLPIEHGRAAAFGYLFERYGVRKAAYLSDCKALKEGVEELIAGVEVLIVDALRHRPHPTHMNVDEALALSRRVAPKQTWFTHLCHELGHADTEATLPAGVKIAYDGLKLTL